MKIIWRIFSRHSASQHPVLCPFRMICPVWNCYYICLRRSISGEYLWKYAPACNNSNNINTDLESTGRVTRFHRVANIIIIFLCVCVCLCCGVLWILFCCAKELNSIFLTCVTWWMLSRHIASHVPDFWAGGIGMKLCQDLSVLEKDDSIMVTLY